MVAGTIARPRGRAGGRLSAAPGLDQAVEERAGEGIDAEEIALGVVMVGGHEAEERLDPLELQPHSSGFPAAGKAEDVGPGLGADGHQLGIHRPAVGIAAAAERDAERGIGQHAMHRPVGERRVGGDPVGPHPFGDARERRRRGVVLVVAEPVTRRAAVPQ